MSHISILGRAAALAAIAGFVAFAAAPAAELPEATKKILKELKVPESILDDIDQELKVPPAWIEGAKKEGEFRIVDTHSDKVHEQMTAPFRARYPFIKIRNTRGSSLLVTVSSLESSLT